MGRDDAKRRGTIDGHVAAFSTRLASILGKGRVARRNKPAKAEAAMQAVEELVAAVEEEVDNSPL